VLVACVAAAPTARIAAQVAKPAGSVRAAGRTTAEIDDALLTEALARFGKLRERQQNKVLSSVRAAVQRLDDPYLRSIRQMAERSETSSKPRHKALRVSKRYARSETARHASSALVDQVPFRSHCAYRWAYGDIGSHEILYPGKRLSKQKRRSRDLQSELEDLCNGYPADAGRALAGIMRELDNERSADRHAVFLNSWKNGDETFYQALARTSGTNEEVFCYDVMLSEWVRRCVGKKHADYKLMIRSMDATQRAFYQMAATYRSYRGLREMVALSLLLPSDQRLPERLARLYEDNAGTGYSTRDNIILLLAAHDGDVDATVKTIVSNLQAMPADAWRAGSSYQPVRGIYAAFDKAMPRLVAGGLHTDKVLALKKGESKALQGRISQTARLALMQALSKSS